MSPAVRKLALAAHLTVAVGWIGAVVAFLVLVLTAQSSPDDHTLRAAWMAMDVIGWYGIVPLAIASLVTGVVMALSTRWGLFRHYWVLISLVLTAGATLVLLSNMRTVTSFADLATGTANDGTAALRRGLHGELLHAGLGLVVLVVIQVLNIYKPRGMTRHGQRMQRERNGARRETSAGTRW